MNRWIVVQISPKNFRYPSDTTVTSEEASESRFKERNERMKSQPDKPEIRNKMSVIHFIYMTFDIQRSRFKDGDRRSKQSTSVRGSFILGKKDPGSGWSRASQKVGGDKKYAGGRSKQVAILSFLNSLLKGQICLKM